MTRFNFTCHCGNVASGDEGKIEEAPTLGYFNEKWNKNTTTPAAAAAVPPPAAGATSTAIPPSVTTTSDGELNLTSTT